MTELREELTKKYLAVRLRKKLREGKSAQSIFVSVLNNMTDDEIVDKYLEHVPEGLVTNLADSIDDSIEYVGYVRPPGG